MSLLQQLTCPNCGAAFRVETIAAGFATCEHCGTSFRVDNSAEPTPAPGKIILKADFSLPPLEGWQVDSEDKKLEYRIGPQSELWATFPPTPLMRTLLSTTGMFDDFDVSLTFRFIAGKPGGMSAGLKLRRSDAGDYLICVAGNGMYSVGWHNQADWGGDFVNWTTHAAIVPGLGVANQIRVKMQRDQLRVYLNGVLANSLRDERFRSGFVRVVTSPPREIPMTIAVSELVLREVE